MDVSYAPKERGAPSKSGALSFQSRSGREYRGRLGREQGSEGQIREWAKFRAAVREWGRVKFMADLGLTYGTRAKTLVVTSAYNVPSLPQKHRT